MDNDSNFCRNWVFERSYIGAFWFFLRPPSHCNRVGKMMRSKESSAPIWFGILFLIGLTWGFIKIARYANTIARLQTQCGIDPELTQPLQKVEAERVGR